METKWSWLFLECPPENKGDEDEGANDERQTASEPVVGEHEKVVTQPDGCDGQRETGKEDEERWHAGRNVRQADWLGSLLTISHKPS